MAETTISWTDYTFNPWIGCTEVSPGCDNCYARTLDRRWGHDSWGKGKPRRLTSAANWRKPLAWAENIKRECEEFGVAFWMKQMSAQSPVKAAALIPVELLVRKHPKVGCA